MSNFSKVPSGKILKQLDFFSSDLSRRSLNIQSPLRKSISAALKRCQFSRDHIASHIGELVGYEVSRSMLDNYVDESHLKHRIPAEIIPALCVVTKDYVPLRLLVEISGAFILMPEEAMIAKLLQVRKERQRLEKEEEILKNRLDLE